MDHPPDERQDREAHERRALEVELVEEGDEECELSADRDPTKNTVALMFGGLSFRGTSQNLVPRDRLQAPLRGLPCLPLAGKHTRFSVWR